MSTELWDKYWREMRKRNFTATADYSRKKEREIMLDYCQESNLLVAEVGSGSASGSLVFARGNNRIFAIDFSRPALLKGKAVYARQGKGNYLVEVQADIKKLPFADNKFNLTWNQGVLEHFKNPREVVREMIRITRGGGYVIAFVPNKYCWESLYYRLRKVLPFLAWDFGEQDFYSFWELRRLFENDAGRIVKVTGVVPLLPPLIVRNSALKKLVNSLIIRPFEMIENLLGDHFKALFGRQVCLVYQKK